MYLSKREVNFKIVMKTENYDYVKKSVNMIDSDEVNFFVAEKQQKDGR